MTRSSNRSASSARHPSSQCWMRRTRVCSTNFISSRRSRWCWSQTARSYCSRVLTAGSKAISGWVFVPSLTPYAIDELVATLTGRVRWELSMNAIRTGGWGGVGHTTKLAAKQNSLEGTGDISPSFADKYNYMNISHTSSGLDRLETPLQQSFCSTR